MIHADMHSQNVLIQEDKLSVIDFDDAGFGWYGFDLAVAVWDRLDFTAGLALQGDQEIGRAHV